MESLERMFVFYEISAIVIIAMGALFLTRKKYVYRNLYNMLFLMVILIVPQSMRLYSLKPYFGEAFEDSYLLVFYGIFFLGIISASCLFVKDNYTVVNADGKMVEEALIAVLEEEGIKHEVQGTKIRLTEYDGFITYRPPLLLNEVGVNFRHIRKLPFFKKIKDSFTYKVKQIERAVFPSLAIFLLLLGLAFLILLIVMQSKFEQIL